jgi:hypothetical protein
VTKIKEDGLRNGVPRETDNEACGGSAAATFAVLTIGVAPEEDPGTGRMMTSPPSNVRAESLEFNSVSAVTGSALTITGYRAESMSRT